jgi:hypothetical protein
MPARFARRRDLERGDYAPPTPYQPPKTAPPPKPQPYQVRPLSDRRRRLQSRFLVQRYEPSGGSFA